MYDTNIYIEPDGSKWWRVFRHNNPSANGLFSSTDDFIHGVKKSDDVWFEVGLAKEYDVKEYLVKQKLTSSDSELKFRLTQTVNAMDATYNDTVQGANVVYNTSSGYSTPSYRGGLRYIGTETYLCWNNGTRDQWWGAIGSWGEFSNGIPSINQGTITTGYLELYIPAQHVFNGSKSSLKFAASGGTDTFDVEAETTWTASTPTFATLSPSTGGTGTTTVTATCPSYTGTTKREETITFTDNDNYTFDVKIRQRALTNGISNLYLGDNQIPTANAIYLGDAGVNTIYLGEEIVYSSGPFVGLKARPLSLSFSNNNLTNEITIQSSENWTITDDSTVGGYYTLENYTTGCDGWVPSYDGSLDGGEIDENGKWFEWQQGVSEITLQEYLENLASYGITATGTACQNARYSVYLAPHSAGGPSWLSYSQTTGSTGKTVVTVTASTTQAERTATITVTSANYSATVSVSQQLIQFLDYIYVDQTRDRYCFIDTGIYPTTDTVATIKYKDMGIDNVCLYGFSISGPYGNDTPQVAPNDNSDYRFVSGKNYAGTIFDINASRINYSSLSVDADGYANVTIGNNYVYDNVAQTSRGTGTTQSSIVTTTIPMYINISNIIRFNSAQIRQGNNLVFDGHAAYYNGVYGVYDNVSKQMLLPYIPTYPVVGGNY